MGDKLKRSLAVLAATALAVMLAGPAQAAPAAGGSCPTPWKSVKSGKTTVLQCVPVTSGNAWVKTTPTPKTIGPAMTQFDTWKASLGLDSLADIAATVEGAQSVQGLLTVAQQGRDAAAQAVADTSAATAAKKAEVDALPAQIQSALATANTANAAVKGPKAEYDSANATVQSLSSAYYSAQRNQTALLAAQLICMFTGTGCSSTSSSASSGYAYTISQYNVAKARADGAYAKYTSYYNDYKAKYDQYKALFDRQPVANAEYADLSAKSQQAAGALPNAEVVLSNAHARVDTLAELTSHFNAFTASQQELDPILMSAGLQTSANWRTAFAQASVAVGRHVVYRNWLTQTWSKYAAMAG